MTTSAPFTFFTIFPLLILASLSPLTLSSFSLLLNFLSSSCCLRVRSGTINTLLYSSCSFNFSALPRISNFESKLFNTIFIGLILFDFLPSLSKDPTEFMPLWPTSLVRISSTTSLSLYSPPPLPLT